MSGAAARTGDLRKKDKRSIVKIGGKQLEKSKKKTVRKEKRDNYRILEISK